jgi:hypothetical protein
MSLGDRTARQGAPGETGPVSIIPDSRTVIIMNTSASSNRSGRHSLACCGGGMPTAVHGGRFC